MAQLKQRNRELMEQLTDTLATLSERARTIAQLQQELTAAGDIARNHPAIAAKDERIRELEAQLKKRESPTYSVVAECNAKIAELEKRNHELRVKVAEEREEKNRLKIENDSLRLRNQNLVSRHIKASSPENSPPNDATLHHSPAIAREELEKIRDRALTSLRLGKQAPGYKAAKQALDEFIDQLQGEEE